MPVVFCFVAVSVVVCSAGESAPAESYAISCLLVDIERIFAGDPSVPDFDFDRLNTLSSVTPK